MYKMPEGQRCQAKDEFGIVPTDEPNVSAWAVATHGCDHLASVMWTEGAMAMIHGAYAWWCECCALDARIKHAEERARELEGLRARRLTACMEEAAGG